MPMNEGRFYTRTRNLPVDTVAPEHAAIHADLEAWGLWNRSRSSRVRCGSAENGYRAPWRQWHYPTASEMMPRNMVNPRNREVDRAVLRMPEQHRETVRRYYVFQQRPEAICRKVAIRYPDFAPWMRDCRAIIINILGSLGA